MLDLANRLRLCMQSVTEVAKVLVTFSKLAASALLMKDHH